MLEGGGIYRSHKWLSFCNVYDIIVSQKYFWGPHTEVQIAQPGLVLCHA
jgi:hypothetical protein